ncbi:MAG: hypothetical protein ACRD0A_07245 [Acidimicrobiales bacterium]
MARWPPAQSSEATGPLAHLVNVAVFAALYLTPSYAPALSVTSDAALLFYGISMLLAAVRGYAGCEVLAVSNWVCAATTRSAAWSSGPSTLPSGTPFRTVRARAEHPTVPAGYGRERGAPSPGQVVL